jgi:hypothetical protein
MEVKENGSEIIILEYSKERIKIQLAIYNLGLRYRTFGLKCRIINKRGRIVRASHLKRFINSNGGRFACEYHKGSFK